ncbi:FAD-dependent oxidoreductase [Cohnella fermenti]|uniref:FAD-dependent oxidoreductase n=1 Tax=Cohnella fermenti TaxID=2565925 RepID=A0A4S4BR50_9BACL|nr:FAD-dependent oxidoreductase [Cohnella fermenti]THF76886.1 FAD-dependent oxidoreductase [Cohnella fermenti]
MISENLFYYRPSADNNMGEVIRADVCVYGGSSAGVAAALQVKRMGLSVVIAEFGQHLGGLSSGGLGQTDIGNKAAIGGIARQFYRELGRRYEGDRRIDGDGAIWQFEPSAAERLFNDWTAEAGIPVYYGQQLAEVGKQGETIVYVTMENGNRVEARMFIDATYEGDLMAMAGVSYHVGREANSVYKETLNGIHFGHPNHNFKTWIDPYQIEGKPDSGLVFGVTEEPPGVQGAGDSAVQAYNFRICLTDVPGNRLPVPMPAGYDPEHYVLLERYIRSGIWDALDLLSLMPNGKTDLNNYGAFSTDMIGMNHRWPEAGYAEREEIFQAHVNYTLGLLYFLGNDERLSAEVRRQASRWGLPLDEYPQTGHWSHQLYVREGRRMIADLVMTEHHCRFLQVVDDPVGLAAYTMDSHNCRRIVADGRCINEGNVEVAPSAPYPISYRSIVPRAEECGNLAVPVCLSSSHIAFGSIRMEPVFMILGQSAGTAAAMALEHGCALQELDYSKLRERLLQDGQVLDWKEIRHVPGVVNP